MQPSPLFPAILAASERLRGHAHRTPIHRSRTLDALAGAEVLLKCENFQRGGAFKFRGAFNAIRLLSDEQRARGVITYSSGNHAQAIALAGRLLGVQTTVVMPSNAPAIKRAATEGYGARVVPYDPATGDRKQIAEALAAEHGTTIIPPYDDVNIVAGQGTAALELIQEAGALDWLGNRGERPRAGVPHGRDRAGSRRRRDTLFPHTHPAHRPQPADHRRRDAHAIPG